MGEKKQYICIDLGTTNLKMIYLDKDELIDAQSFRYQNTNIQGKDYQLDAEEVLSLLSEGLRKLVMKHNLSTISIALTSAMHSAVVLDEHFYPKSPIYTWADRNGGEFVPIDRSKTVSQYVRTGTPIHIMNPYFKWQYLLKIYQPVKTIGSIKDLVMAFLTGNWMIDLACASGSGLFSLEESNWDQELLTYLGISTVQLPKIVLPNVKCKLKDPQRFGLKSGLVYPGFSDGVSSNGSTLYLENAAVLSFGTSFAIRVISNQVQVDAKYQNFCYQFSDNQYIIGFPSNNAGNVLEWICQKEGVNFDDLSKISESDIEIKGAFLPFVYGERSPIWNDQAKEEYYMENNLTKKERIFTMLSGVFYNVKMNVDLLQSMTIIDKIVLTGGLSINLSLCQLLSNILEIPIYISTEPNQENIGTMNLLGKHPKTSDYTIIYPHANNTLKKGYEIYKQIVEQKYL